jgi:hypothetical protein
MGWWKMEDGARVEPRPLLYQPWVTDGDDCGAITGMNEWQGKPEYSEGTCPSGAASITDPT